jgi:DNA-binding response OmpR family regulator
VHVAHVRSKLAAAGSSANIETVWGVGYKLVAES